VDRALGGQRRTLIGGETLGTRVGQQPVETAGKVGQMESNRGSSPGPSPELRRRQVLNDRYYILAHLQ
jgi:hypothetical protein